MLEHNQLRRRLVDVGNTVESAVDDEARVVVADDDEYDDDDVNDDVY